MRRYEKIEYKGFKGIILGFNKHGYIKEYKVRLTQDNGNYKKGTIIYLNSNCK